MTLRPIEKLIEELDEYTGFTKYDLVDEAVARQEEITSHLLSILEQISADQAFTLSACIRGSSDFIRINTYDQ